MAADTHAGMRTCSLAAQGSIWEGCMQAQKVIQVSGLRCSAELHQLRTHAYTWLITSLRLLTVQVVHCLEWLWHMRAAGCASNRECSCCSTAIARHVVCRALRLSQKAAAIMTARKPYMSRSGRDVNSATLAILERRVSARHAGTLTQFATPCTPHSQACTLAQQGIQRAHQLLRSPCIPPHNLLALVGGLKSNSVMLTSGAALLRSGAHSSTAPPNSQTPATMMA